MTKISFVYFDVGGVVLLDYSGTHKWEEMKAGLGVTPTTNAQFENIWDSKHDLICLDYDVEQYVPQFRRLGLPVPTNYSMVKDFVDRYDPNPTIWSLIDNLKKKVKVGLLTNMYPKLLSTIYSRGDLLLRSDWDITIDSSVVKAQKPDIKIYLIAQEQAGVSGSEILFIDNQQRHLDGAKQLGWQTFLYDSKDYEKSSQELAKFLESYL